MSKLLFGILGFSLMLFFVADGVIIEDNTPSSMSPGSSANISITINKGTVEDFAKLEIELPEGMSATPIQTNGASFSFKDQKVKFIWMSLPSDQEFQVSYKLSAAPDASGNKIVKGTFSYIKSNQRVDYELQSKVIRIGEESIAESREETNDAEPIANTDATPQTDLSSFGGSGMRCVRSILGTSDKEFIVTLTVLENELENFAKIQENIPAGFVVSEEDSDGAVVTISDRGIKYVWFEAPQMDEFSVSYRLTTSTPNTPNISGVFSYVEDNAPKEVNVVKGPIETQEGMLAANETEEEVTPEAEVRTADPSEGEESSNNTNSTAVESNESAGEAMAENEIAEEAQTTTEESEPASVEESVTADVQEEIKEVKKAVTSIPEPETGVSYRVQIAASHQVVGQSYFAKKHGFTRNVNIENHEGWVKYTTGAHNVYKSARDDRNQIRDAFSFRGPFVTAYNDGVRITVQEALMITKQQWYK
jgi:hypothetical protein